MQQARSGEENAIAERLRAERSSEAAREADVSASASVYAFEAVKKHKETGEAVRATRKATRSLVRSGKAALNVNEKRIKTINDALFSAYRNVTKEENRAPLVPCDTKSKFSVTSDLTETLSAIERLASLTNTSYAFAALRGLQQNGRQVKHLKQQVKENADAAEQVCRAAQKAAENSKCMPLSPSVVSRAWPQWLSQAYVM
ncbi:hypothetical protein TRVL_08839 [Trypanosoma vivax]|nr:hypothetical protein TRVL_08839 [Trypanosoma vivax]